MNSLLPERADTGHIGFASGRAGTELIMIRSAVHPRALGPKPDLGQLKRQAKELLAAFHAGDESAIAEVRGHFRIPQGKSLALSHAQLVLARAYGFESWPKLKAHVDGATWERLVDAVKAGDLDRVRALLKARPELINMEQGERDEHRALHFAVLLRNPAMVRLLMEHGADASIGIYPHRDATRPLLIARERGYDEIVAIIEEVQGGRAVQTRQAEPESWNRSLHAAVEQGDEQRLTDLLETRDDWSPPADAELLRELLQACARKGNLAMAKILLEHGADPNHMPLFTAYRERDPAMLELFAAHGGVVDAETAGYHRDRDRARELLSLEAAAALPGRTVNEGKTVAEDLLSGDCGDPEIVRMALATLDWRPDDARWYAILRHPISFWNHIPWIKSDKWPMDRSGYLTSFKLILARSHANASGTFGRVILHDVVVMGLRDGVPDWISEEEVCGFVAALLDAGASLDLRDELLRSTPLGWACRWGRAKVARFLIERGADPLEADAEPWATPHAWAVKRKHTAVLDVLREHSA